MNNRVACRAGGSGIRVYAGLLLLLGFVVSSLGGFGAGPAAAEVQGSWAWPGTRFLVSPVDSAHNLETAREVKCTAGFPATDNLGRRLFLTAGHCGRKGDAIYSLSDDHKEQKVGTIIYSHTVNEAAVGNVDVAVVAVDAGHSLGGENFHIEYHGQGRSRVNSVVCLRDALTGLSCGRVVSPGVNQRVRFPNGHVANYLVFSANMCTSQGDSGGPVYGPQGALGLVTADYPSGQDCSKKPWLQLGEKVPVGPKPEQYVRTFITPLADCLDVAGRFIPGLRLL